MPTFLSDPPQIVYLLLGGLLVITGAIAAQKQDRRSAIPFSIAFLLTLPVAFHCIFILGFQTYDTRVLVHSVLGTFLYGVFAVKVLIVRDHGLPGWVLPVAGGAALLEGHKLLKTGLPHDEKVAFALGIVVSALVGYAVIAWLIGWLRRRSLNLFVVYRVLLGLAILAVVYARR